MVSPLQQMVQKVRNRYTLSANQATAAIASAAGAMGGGRDMTPVTPQTLVYNSLATGTGTFNGDGKTWYDNVAADVYTAAELAPTKYVYAPRVQQVLGSIRSADESQWDTIKSKYAALGLDRPQRLQAFRCDICQWTSSGEDIFTDANIHTAGPTWNLDDITSPPGETITIPTNATDPGYQGSEGTGLTFAAAKAILDTAGWTWTNYSVNPFGALFSPYEFQTPEAMTFDLIHTRMDLSNDSWIEALTNFIISALQNGELNDLDGVMGSFSKAFHYYGGYRTGTGRGPGYPDTDDPESTGIDLYLLEYWTRTRTGGPAAITNSWDASDNGADETQPFPTSSGHLFDLPSITSYEYLEGIITLCRKLRLNLPVGKELHWNLCFESSDTGLWQSSGSAFRRSWRDDYIALNPGTTQQEAQDVLLSKMYEIADQCDGLIIPSAAETGADPNDGTVTAIEPATWWEGLADKASIQYAS